VAVAEPVGDADGLLVAAVCEAACEPQAASTSALNATAVVLVMFMSCTFPSGSRVYAPLTTVKGR